MTVASRIWGDQFSRPVFSAHWNMAGCRYSIRVNDGPVFEEMVGYAMIGETAINGWIINGGNTVAVLARPIDGDIFGEDLDVEVTIYLRDFGTSVESRREVCRLELRFADLDSPPNNVQLNRDGEEIRLLAVSSNFDARVPFGPWRWERSAPMDDRNAAANAVLPKLREFHTWLAEGEIDPIVKSLGLRDSEIATARYESFDERSRVTRREFEALLERDRWNLADLDESGLRVRLFGNGRLIRLDDKDGDSPIYLNSKASDLATYLPLMFCESSPNAWVICR